MAAVRGWVLITGRVQGVSFRYYIREQAEKLGLSGWVRNVSKGPALAKATARQGVEAMFEGEKSAVEEMIKWCKVGSSSAAVTKVEVKWGDAENLRGFEIKETV